jgi:PAS domain S-box-containing protein
MTGPIIAITTIALGAVVVVALLWVRMKRGDALATRPRAVNSLFQTAFEHHPAGVGYMTPEGRWIGANARLLAELGYTRAELIATSLMLLTHPQDRKQEAALFVELRGGRRRFYQMKKRLRRKGGEYGTYRVQMFGCSDGTTHVLQCIIEVAENEATFLERVADTLHQLRDTAVVLFDGAGTITRWNAGAEQLYGFAEAEMLGRSWGALHPDHGAATAKLRIAAAAEHGKASSATVRRRKDGSTVEVTGTILSEVRLGDPSAYLEICRQREQTSGRKEDEETADLRARNASLRDQLTNAEEEVRELRDSITALRAANGEFVRKIRMLTAMVRKTVATRSATAKTEHRAPDQLSVPLLEAGVTEVKWIPVAGAEIKATIGEVVTKAQTGTLLLDVGGVERRLVFREGMLVACASDDHEHAIGRLLIEAGIIGEKQLRAALEAHSITSLPIGSSLIQMELITKGDLESAILRKALLEISEAGSRETIQCAFVSQDLSPPGLVPVAIDLFAALGGEAPPVIESSPVSPEAPERTLVGRAGTRSRVYHDPACSTARRIPRKQRVHFASAAQAESENFRRCARCLSEEAQ